ncbi:MAG: hypothetical protein JJU29_18495 [Verrucomicrobia bacterium]|nr:hypothetical protein [Verrucomicrobiota bacterium]MCH8512325.1 hypothetical protein [Kiritimatiellia bacterium]
MSQSNTRVGDIKILAGNDLRGKEGYLVKLGSASGKTVAVLPDDIEDLALFLVLEGADAGEHVSLRPLSSERNVRVRLLGGCLAGSPLVLTDMTEEDDAGKVRALPGSAGNYRLLLIAEETGLDGQLVLARPAMVGVVTVEE